MPILNYIMIPDHYIIGEVKNRLNITASLGVWRLSRPTTLLQLWTVITREIFRSYLVSLLCYKARLRLLKIFPWSVPKIFQYNILCHEFAVGGYFGEAVTDQCVNGTTGTRYQLLSSNFSTLAPCSQVLLFFNQLCLYEIAKYVKTNYS